MGVSHRLRVIVFALILLAPRPGAAEEASGKPPHASQPADRMDAAVGAEVTQAGRAVVLAALEPLAGETIEEACTRVENDLLARGGVAIRHRFRSVPALLAEIQGTEGLLALEGAGGISSVRLDARGEGALQESTGYIRGDEARALGFSGEGTTVAVIDSGIAAAHPSFEGAVVHQYHFLDQGAILGEGAEDEHGHGTHVAGILASRGVGAPPGIAPGARIIAIRVLDRENSGWISDWAAAVDHVVSLRAEEGLRVDVINMSLMSRSSHPGACEEEYPVFSMVCQAARDQGIMVLAASGNQYSLSEMSAPACFSSVFSVGSTHDSLPDRISAFTDRSENLDMLAPGQEITSTGLADSMTTMTGTSQACPHAAGVACLLREIRPAGTPGDIEEALRRSGRPYTDSETSISFPILDARAAVEAFLTPRVERLVCAGTDSRVTASWKPSPEADHYRVEVRRGSDILFAVEVGGDESSFEWEYFSTGVHEVCVRAYNEAGLKGLDECCSLELRPEPLFLRADCTQDADLNITDPIQLLTFLFGGNDPPGCREACNSNDDDRLDLSDAVYSLQFLFLGGPTPRAPFEICGPDPDGAPLGCDESGC